MFDGKYLKLPSYYSVTAFPCKIFSWFLFNSWEILMKLAGIWKGLECWSGLFQFLSELRQLGSGLWGGEGVDEGLGQGEGLRCYRLHFLVWCGHFWSSSKGWGWEEGEEVSWGYHTELHYRVTVWMLSIFFSWPTKIGLVWSEGRVCVSHQSPYNRSMIPIQIECLKMDKSYKEMLHYYTISVKVCFLFLQKYVDFIWTEVLMLSTF